MLGKRGKIPKSGNISFGAHMTRTELSRVAIWNYFVYQYVEVDETMYSYRDISR